MKKIPVGATIAHAYRFAFGDFLTVLRSIWLPLLVQLGLSILVGRYAISLFQALAAKDPSAVSLLGPIVPLYAIILILFFAQLEKHIAVMFYYCAVLAGLQRFFQVSFRVCVIFHLV